MKVEITFSLSPPPQGNSPCIIPSSIFTVEHQGGGLGKGPLPPPPSDTRMRDREEMFSDRSSPVLLSGCRYRVDAKAKAKAHEEGAFHVFEGRGRVAPASSSTRRGLPIFDR